jgi:invasion protein IalB
MRDTVIGVVLAVAFAAAIFAVGFTHPHTYAPVSVQAASEVQPGFTGLKAIGPWELACAKGPAAGAKTAIPFSLNPDPKSSAAATAQNALGRCRAALIYRRKDNPKAIVAIITFRYSTDFKKLAMIVRFPQQFAQKDDKLMLQVGRQGASIEMPVSQCTQGGCMAAGLLEPPGQNLILSAKQGVLVFPAKKGAKPFGMLVPLAGLKDVFDAMRRAES